MLHTLIQPSPADAGGGVRWLHAIDPSAAEQRLLVAEHGVPAAFIAHALDVDERARLDHEAGADLVVLRVPHAEGPAAALPYRTVPLALVLRGTSLVSISPVAAPLVERVARDPAAASAPAERLLLLVLRATAEEYLAQLDELDGAVAQVERRLERSLRNREVLELLRYQKSLTYFTIGRHANDVVLQRLERHHRFAEPPERALLEDVTTELAQANESALVSSNILSQMMDAFASIISNNLNVVVKFLTAITVVLSIPTLIASLYGMNVGLPGQHHPAAFAAVAAASLGIALGVTWVFWRRGWM